ncbi:MAG: replication-associated recombination protein A [Phycisphaerales bacterium]|nr:replication-associated recombination protein A [Phycisphaerales bacterium]
MDLFADTRRRNRDRVAPLAVRMRPRSLEEFVGQQHFLGPGKLLRRMLDADRLVSILFYGPPGTGKTTLAQLIATHTRSHFEELNAASAGVKEVRAVLDAARQRVAAGGTRTVLFLDEIHRFNRAQQDVLLNDVEAGLIILIGATTENPFFAVNSALVSRSQIFQFAALSEEEIRTLVLRAIRDEERGFGKLNITIDDDALQFLAVTSDGDARRALTAVEIAVLSSIGDLPEPNLQEAGRPQGTAGATLNPSNPPTLGQVAPSLRITLDIAQQSMQRKAIVYDPTGDDHFDAASALIKAMRGSDPDAAVYWLARMLQAGEDPRFIARRIAIFASEDIGNADPQALTVAASAQAVTERIGMPECELTLGQAVIYMATAPKSNACAAAIWAASEDVREGRTLPVPKHLRDASYPGAKRLGHGTGYRYPHQYADSLIEQDYLGVDKAYYSPTDRGFEATIRQRLEQWRKTLRERTNPQRTGEG